MVKSCIDLFETRNDLADFDKPQGCTLTPAVEHNEHKNRKTAKCSEELVTTQCKCVKAGAGHKFQMRPKWLCAGNQHVQVQGRSNLRMLPVSDSKWCTMKKPKGYEDRRRSFNGSNLKSDQVSALHDCMI